MSVVSDFTLSLSDLEFVGHDLNRPESVVAERDGTLWMSDTRGIVMRRDPDGKQTLLGDVGGEPNGLAMDRDGVLYNANMVDGRVYKIRRDGAYDVILEEVDGQPIHHANFVFIDSRDRLWVSVPTRDPNWWAAVANPRPDGCIVLLDSQGASIVADDIYFTNEIRMNADESYMYAVETLKSRIVRYAVRADGSLGHKEVVGPDDPPPAAYIDGFAFDSEGNIWLTTVLRNGLVIVTPDGDAHTVIEEPNDPAIEHWLAKAETGEPTPEDMLTLIGQTLQFPTSVCFAGPDLRTVYLGSLAMPHLVQFRSPVPGLPLRHW